jgi:hypothetical protein
VRKFLVLVLGSLAALVVGFMVWSSSPAIPLTLSRQQAVEQAAVDATVKNEIAWTRVESKLVTYREWTRVIGIPTSGRGAREEMNPDALFWVVAYLGPLVSMEGPGYRCDWVLRVFAADQRAPATYGASMCGMGGWRWEFAVLPDRSWWRLEDLRGR